MPVQNTPISGVLLADQGNSTIPGSSKVLLLRDLNGDGDASDAGERGVFFDATNASGLQLPTENVFTVHQARDGAVFIGDGDTDTVYRLLDRNNDGDANDENEATPWLTSNVRGGFSLITPNGITQGPDDAIYIANAGTSTTPQDAIYRTRDLNGDGDASDAGETSVWLDLRIAAEATSPSNLNRPVPYELEFTSGNTAYLIDPNGNAPLIRRIEDVNTNGTIDAGEVTTFIADPVNYGAPIDFSLEDQGNSVLTWEWLDNGPADGKFSLYRLTDLDGSKIINAQAEAVEVWNSTYLPVGFAAAVGFSVAADGFGRVALTSNGSAANTKNVFLLEDVDNDGLYTSPGETIVLASASFDATTLYRPRAVEFYNGPAPVITSNGAGDSAAVSVAENTVAVTTVTATDLNTVGTSLRYGVSGTDAGLFTIDSVTGALAFALAPDAENPRDAGSDNIYDVVVSVTDGALTDTQALAITVGDVDDTVPPLFPAPSPAQPTGGSDTLTLVGRGPLDAGAGNDTVSAGSGSGTVLGGDGADQITGTPAIGQQQVLFGGKGLADPTPDADTIRVSGQGSAVVYGNGGDDLIDYRASGAGTIFGGMGGDRIDVRNDGANIVYGGMNGPGTFDVVTIAGNGNNIVFGGNQSADADDGNDFVVVTGNGNNTLFGNGGDDVISVTGSGSNFLHGGRGNDQLTGGSGADTLNGGLDFNLLTGGGEADRFVHTGGGHDFIADFSFSDGDRIDTGGQSYTVGQDAEGQAALFFADGGTLVLQGYTPEEFSAGFVA